MNISAIISEYNPFHNGHAYHIKKTKELGASHIIVIMSSNFVQRGSVAIFEKQERTKMALLNGANLVLELPAIWSLSCAEKYAFSAAVIADALGVVNCLSFGSESGSIKALKKANEALISKNTKASLKQNLNAGLNFPVAMQNSVCECFGKKVANLLKSPNNILALEYIKSLNKLNSNIEPVTVKRKGCVHDEITKGNSEFYSASQVRQNIILNNDINKMVPDSVLNIIEDAVKNKRVAYQSLLERAILAKLRVMPLNEFANLPDISEGLENRIYSAVNKSCSFDDLYTRIKTKRYTLARIRRIIFSAFIGINKNATSKVPPYVRVLGFNEGGAQILKKIKKTSKIPIITNVKQIYNLDNISKSVFKTECMATDLYMLAMPKISSCGFELTRKIVKV